MSDDVVALAYVVITAEDPDTWAEFATSVLGLAVGAPPASPPERDTRFLRMDERSWRLAVERGEDGGLAALGLEVASQRVLDRLRGRLLSAGLQVKEAPEAAAHRRVLDLFRVTDPVGIPLEFFYGLKTDKEKFVSPRGARFVTGRQGIGHVVLMGGQGDDMHDFYVELLGFRVSDVISVGGGHGYFTSPSPRHHTVAFARGITNMPTGLSHIMLQVEDIDSVGRALDRVYERGIPLRSGLGRHTNDHMVSFYCESPSGLTIEFGWDGREIDDVMHVTGSYDAASYWGHHSSAAAGDSGRLGEVRAEPPRR